MAPMLLTGLLVLAAPEPDDDPLLLDPVQMRYDRPKVEWDEDWDRFRWWEYVANGVMVPGGLALRFMTQPPGDNFGGPILFDDPAEDLLLSPTLEGRSLAGDAADALFFGAMAYRVVDDLVVVGLGHGNGDVALQMSMIDLQAFGVVAATLWTTQLFVGRERPHSRRCDDPGVEGGDLGCGSDDENNRYRSFISGHPALVVAAAGVTCMHHSRMPIYGGGVGDNLACASMIGAAATTGVLRVVSGSHHASDVVFGTALGLVAGWVVPSALHYGFGEDDEDELATTPSDGAPAVRVAFVPFGPRGAIGAQVTGVVF